MKTSRYYIALCIQLATLTHHIIIIRPIITYYMTKVFYSINFSNDHGIYNKSRQDIAIQHHSILTDQYSTLF